MTETALQRERERRALALPSTAETHRRNADYGTAGIRRKDSERPSRSRGDCYRPNFLRRSNVGATTGPRRRRRLSSLFLYLGRAAVPDFYVATRTLGRRSSPVAERNVSKPWNSSSPGGASSSSILTRLSGDRSGALSESQVPRAYVPSFKPSGRLLTRSLARSLCVPSVHPPLSLSHSVSRNRARARARPYALAPLSLTQ